MQTRMEKLEALWQRLQQRCALENQGRLNKPPVTESEQTAVAIEIPLVGVTEPTRPAVVTLGDLEQNHTFVRGELPAEVVDIITDNAVFGLAFLEKLHRDVYAAILEQKPFLKDADAILAGTAVISFYKKDNTPNFDELENGNVKFGAYSDAIPYPAAFLK